MSQDSQRVMETKDRIKEAFFELYETKKIERISIKEITEKAKLNRGTFYVYYKDIYDLLEKTEDELIVELMEKIKKIVVMILRDEDIGPFLPPLEFYERNQKILRSLLGPNGDPNFIHKLKKIIKSLLGEIFRKEQLPQVKNLEYVMEYISSAQIGIISFWLVDNNMELPITEIGDMIKQITLHGPVGYVKKQMET
ncbi:MAG: TetR-like C-terminal domain-containing protein [Bacillota bacterium]